MKMFTKEMRLLTAVVLNGSRDAVVKELLKLGVMDFVKIKDIDEEDFKRLESRPADSSESEAQILKERIESAYKLADMSLPDPEKIDLDSVGSLNLSDISAFVNTLSADLQNIKDRQAECNRKMLAVEEMLSYAKEGRVQYLDVRVGNISADISDLRTKLHGIPFVVLPEENGDLAVVMTMRRDGLRVNPLLDKFGWTETDDIPQQKKAVGRCVSFLEENYARFQKMLSELQAEGKNLVKSRSEDLEKAWATLTVSRLCNEMTGYFSYTRNTAILSGWVPAESAADVEAAIKRATDGKCVIEWNEMKDVPRNEVPVDIAAPPILKPFSKIVANYSTPEYGTVNPVPFVTVAYLTMFALMFADVGQGFVLMLIGIFKTLDYRKNPLKKDGLLNRNVSQLLIYLGIASMVGGALFGSYFGYEVLPAIWFNYHHVVNGGSSNGYNSIYQILGITIWYGVAVIYTGLVINWINLIREKNWMDLIFHKNGVLGGFLYGVGIWAANGFVRSGYKTMPSSPFLMPAIIIPLVILLFKVPVERIVEKKKGGGLIMDTLMEWLVTVLEIFSGYLANTLSFMRVAGLGIAHVSLMVAFADMAAMYPGVAGVIIQIIGNLLVIAVEGLSAGIQALRLNYYEFFTKFFNGKGITYRPIGLKTRAGATNRN